MKFLIFILVLSLQVQAAGKCAQYFVAIADLKKLEDTTRNQKAFAKALIEEPHADVLVKISKEFGVSLDEIKNDIKAMASTAEAITNTEVKSWRLTKTRDIKPEGEITTIEAMHGGYFTGSPTKPSDVSYWVYLFDSTGKKSGSPHQLTGKHKLTNKDMNDNPAIHSNDEIISPSGQKTLKMTPEFKVELRTIFTDSNQKFDSTNRIVTATWGDIDSRVFTLEHKGTDMKIVWSLIKNGKFNTLNEHSLERLCRLDELIVSPDNHHVLILHKNDVYQIKEASIWHPGLGTFKKLELGATYYTSAHFTTRNNIVFSIGTEAKIFSIDGTSQGPEHSISLVPMAKKISPDGDYAVILSDSYVSLYHFDTQSNMLLPNHLKKEQVSFAPDEAKLYLLEARDKISVWENISLQLKPKKGSK